ncbi:COX5A domain-containing protein [Rhizoctonia solani AG-1 IA]|uniref:Cytochrome c oxidase subunit 6, mitochondrial n=1 Tax=Thanatephorus cucumeris (strain AG1-IA) TaxID=983506 RepID=L8WRM4_THACA|nr:COX5A domain-containing protein [Rhizoctonia solani AG-1 IA]
MNARMIARSLRPIARTATPVVRMGSVRAMSGSHAHENESFESFSARYEQFFGQVQDLFELQRGLNNCFAYDLVPSTGVIEAALRAARRVNDYSTAVRIFEGIREKVENKGQYEAYLNELKGVREELASPPETFPTPFRHYPAISDGFDQRPILWPN